jgi:hypothetical protein
MVVMLALVIPLLSAVVPIALAIVILAGKGERRNNRQQECAKSEFHCVCPVLGTTYASENPIRNSINSKLYVINTSDQPRHDVAN